MFSKMLTRLETTGFFYIHLPIKCNQIFKYTTAQSFRKPQFLQFFLKLRFKQFKSSG